MAAQVFFMPFPMAFTSNGLPAGGAELYFYEPGTLTPKDVYTEATLTTEHAHPVVADGAGRFASIYLDSETTYRLIIKDSAGNTLTDIDNLIPGQVADLEPYLSGAQDAQAAAETQAAAAAASATSAATQAALAAAYADSALSTANVYNTKAEATADLANIVADDYALVLVDESDGERRVIYQKSGGVLVSRAVLPSFDLVTDHKSREIVPPGNLGHRSQGLKLRKALSDIKAGARKSIRIMAVGDSLSTDSWTTVNVQLQKVLENWMGSTPVYSSAIGVLAYGTASSAAATTATTKTGTATLVDKTDFDAGWDGTVTQINAGQYAIYSTGGNSTQGDKIYVPIITDPGAGSVRIEIANTTTPPAVGAGDWRAPTDPEIVSAHTLTAGNLIVGAAGVHGVSVVEIDVPLGYWAIKVTHEAGAQVRARFPMVEVATTAAFNTWRIGSASNDFSTALTTGGTVEAGIMAAYDPDIIVVDSDDRLAAYQNFLPKLETAITTAALALDPLVLLVANPFYNNTPYTDADIIERAGYLHEFAASRLGWDVLDGIALSGGLAEATAAGWQSDGIHYQADIAYWMAHTWAADRGYLPTESAPGGTAGYAEALSLPNLAADGAFQPLPSRSVPAALLAPSFDLASRVWGSTVAGTGALTQNNAKDITLATGATAASTAVAFVNENGSLLGSRQNQVYLAEVRGFSTRIRTTTNWDTLAEAYIVMRSNAVAYNAAYVGTLVAEGIGFRLTYNGSALLIHGICWDAGALVVSASSATLSTGGASNARDLTVLCHPETVNSVRGDLEWFVGGVSLGTSNYAHGVNVLPPRIEIKNGATAANRNIMFTPPRFVSVPQ